MVEEKSLAPAGDFFDVDLLNAFLRF